jgi:hypothetical protein
MNWLVKRLPSSVRRGGRDIKKNAAKPPLRERTGWSLTHHDGVIHHPVCATKDASRLFITGAATPPHRGGEYGVAKQYGRFIHLQRPRLQK